MLKFIQPGGMKALAAENAILRKQLGIVQRNKKRAPKLSTSDRIILGFLAAFISPKRLAKTAIIVKPRTLLKLHKCLVKRKYSKLFSNKQRRKPGPKGPDQVTINIILEMKRRNPRYGYRRIAMQIINMFGINIDKDVVRRVLAKHYKPDSNYDGPSWLTFIGHLKDSLWSVDLFRTESILLKMHWVMVVMDQFTRRIIGIATHVGYVDGIALCCMFNKIISGKKLPKYLSMDNDPLFNFQRWKANLRVVEIKEIKSVPYAPRTHPFIERLIGSIRREFLDQILFWNKTDLQIKLNKYQQYYNELRGHGALNAQTPMQKAKEKFADLLNRNNFCWKSSCHDLFHLPVAV